ncbi:MAG: hypothetical protein E6I22_01695 [Chloroflexi bacterium]|nr:MAG: hypothetical protein E6I22_01695 [Chloroflexota bacterium]TMG36900.1 MAG: hypothetical protein E6H92_09085 [Chloroflexota bacterium]
MGDLQTFFYLALIAVVMLGLAGILVGVAIAGLVRWFRHTDQPSALTFWLVGGAIVVVLLFFVGGTVGILYGFLRYGAS